MIGLRGLIGAGKSTIAGIICNLSENTRAGGKDVEATVLSFAGPIRDGLAKMGITKKDTPELYRAAAQAIGAIARKYDPDHWVKQLKKELEILGDNLFNVIVIDDVRYPNEAPVCTHLFIITPDDERPLQIQEEVLKHESEQWNLAHTLSPIRCAESNPITIPITNWKDKPELAAQTILDFVFPTEIQIEVPNGQEESKPI